MKMADPRNAPEVPQEEIDEYAAAMLDARIKLREAEQAWYKALGAAPAGNEREWAATVYERIQCATRRL